MQHDFWTLGPYISDTVQAIAILSLKHYQAILISSIKADGFPS